MWVGYAGMSIAPAIVDRAEDQSALSASKQQECFATTNTKSAGRVHRSAVRKSLRHSFNDYFTFAWNPAVFSALITASASKSPVTSNVVTLAAMVVPLTPSTFVTVFLMPVVHWPQQL